MKLTLHRIMGYEGTKPIHSSDVVATFKGNTKKCDKAAKAFIKENPGAGNLAYKWSK